MLDTSDPRLVAWLRSHFEADRLADPIELLAEPFCCGYAERLAVCRVLEHRGLVRIRGELRHDRLNDDVRLEVVPTILDVQPKEAGTGDDEPPDANENLIGCGAEPRDEWFLAQYEAEDTATYHRPAIILKKWSAMPMAERKAICPDAPGSAITTGAVRKAIQRRQRAKTAGC